MLGCKLKMQNIIGGANWRTFTNLFFPSIFSILCLILLHFLRPVSSESYLHFTACLSPSLAFVSGWPGWVAVALALPTDRQTHDRFLLLRQSRKLKQFHLKWKIPTNFSATKTN